MKKKSERIPKQKKKHKYEFYNIEEVIEFLEHSSADLLRLTVKYHEPEKYKTKIILKNIISILLDLKVNSVKLRKIMLDIIYDR